MAEASIETFAELIEKRHDCLQLLHAMGSEQLELINAGKIDQLMLLLDQKQSWAEALQRIGRELAPFGNQDPEMRIWPDLARQRSCRRLWEQSKQFHTEIIELEQRGLRELKKRRDRVGRQLLEVNTAHEAWAAYARDLHPAGGRKGGQLDLSSED